MIKKTCKTCYHYEKNGSCVIDPVGLLCKNFSLWKKKRNKYGNNKVEFDGFIFDSEDEFNYYMGLKKEKEAGRVLDIKVHPVYELQEKFLKGNKKNRPITYIADFEVVGKIKIDDQTQVINRVIDIKGMATEAAKIKRKLFDFKYLDKTLIWVAWSKIDGGWVEYDRLIKNRAKRKKAKKDKKNHSVTVDNMVV